VFSIALSLVSGLTFLSSFHLYSLSPIGYVLKVFSIYLIYRTTAITGLTKPDYLLFKNLRQSEDALRKAHDEMENRVRERTAQIQVANEQLRREIKERERTEEALRESERRFRLLVESVKDYAIFLLDPRGHIISWNVGAERIHGYQSEEIIGQPLSVFYTDQDKKLGKPEEAMRMAMAEGRYEGQGWRVKKDGSRFWGDMVITELRDKAGVLRGFAKVARDITARKLAENALRESEERLRELFDSAPVGYHELNLQGRIIQVNQTELGMLGYMAKEMIGQPVWKFIVEEDQFREAMMAKLTKGVSSSKALEHNFKRKDGTSFPALVEDLILKDSVGSIKGIRSTLQDITERKKAEEEMVSLQEQFRQSQKMEAIGRLAGGIAHDFNNLLTIIKGYSQLSLMELTEDHPLKGSIQEISKAADRASGLTRQLLAFSRRQILEVKVLDFNALLHDLEKMLHRILGEDIELATFLSENLGRVKADPGQMEQVIMNLAVNARDAMSSGGKLTIETKNVELDQEYARSHVGSKPGHYVMVSASDTGVGMPPEIRERIFEPFFTTKEKGKGTGLGLSTVYGIVKQSQGNIWVYSEPGYGTTFKIYLPQVDEPVEASKDKLSERELVGGNETILVVEDEEEVRKLTVRILKDKGYRVLTASDGNAALAVGKRYVSPIHLMLTDVVMPGLNGRELAKKMESFHPKMKVLYMSGYTENAIVHHGILEEKMDYLPKPFTVEGLTKKVREALDKSDGER
jgi:PAS domain S-box-containing protein